MALELVTNFADELMGHHEEEDVGPSTGFQQVWLCHLRRTAPSQQGVVSQVVLCVLSPGRGEQGLERNCWGLQSHRNEVHIPMRAGGEEGLV